jgi:hypothetical protein
MLAAMIAAMLAAMIAAVASSRARRARQLSCSPCSPSGVRRPARHRAGPGRAVAAADVGDRLA